MSYKFNSYLYSVECTVTWEKRDAFIVSIPLTLLYHIPDQGKETHGTACSCKATRSGVQTEKSDFFGGRNNIRNKEKCCLQKATSVNINGAKVFQR